MICIADDVGGKALELENETRLKVGESLVKIETALAEWGTARSKPKGLEKRIIYLRLSHSLLSAWARDSVRGRKDKESMLDRLAAFVDLCGRLEHARGKLYGRRKA